MKKLLLLITIVFFYAETKAQLTPPTALQSYYNDVDFTLTGTQLFDDLATVTISKHTNILEYFSRHDYLYSADQDIANTDNVVLMYNGESRDKREYQSGSNQHTPQTFNTEHVYPQSLIVNNAIGDLHHLRSCDININSNRGNLPFTDGSGNYALIGNAWYPGDDWKGDVARMIMYLNLRYNESFTDVGTLNLFLKWNREDPVSDFEKQRNTEITTAQGNRNPFIDNPYLATVIWGGTAAQNTWGDADTEAPTVPTNVTLSNITAATIDVTWLAATDNIAVTKYEVYANGTLNGETADLNYTATGLEANTNYAITVLAKDQYGNKSAQSTAANGTTLTDNTAPTVPTNIAISNISGTSFKATWTASTDNVAVESYTIYIDGSIKGTTTNTEFDVTGLNISTTYAVTVLAKDTSGNESAQSDAVNETTTDGSAASDELFFSEYVEGSGNNKAIEIANFTGQTVSLANYSVKLGSNGQDFGTQTLTFTTETIADGDVFVIGNSQITICTSEVDVFSNVTFFNGNDVLGLFKNDVLIDIIGEENNSSDFGKNVTLVRKASITSPNTVYNANEWQEGSGVDDCTNLGTHDVSTASLENLYSKNFKIYPNPTTGNKVYFNLTKEVTINVYNVLGKLIKTEKANSSKNNIDIATLVKGVYLLKINTANETFTRKFIKN